MTESRGHKARGGTSSDKTLSVMDLFTPENPEWTVEAAASALCQSESTVYRYFRSLAAAGLVFSIRPGRYLLGPGIVHYDRQLRTTDPLLRAAEPTFTALSSEHPGPGTVFISRIYREHVMAMHEHHLGSDRLREGTFARGRLAPLFAGPPALAILAFLEVRAVRAMFQKASLDDSRWLDIKRQMRAIRTAGYAASNDDPDPGVLLISVPLKQDDGGIAGSLSLALPTTPDNVAAAANLGIRLAAAADEMASRILSATTD
ncbi:IclR family transcriptional regulator [Novosphingobium resinovorum]|uniref:IclR family transcriptional regulator n=1 Tax=Novosphingobium resinovorum TaxID=158500 RepID=UPI002ED049DA|nr:helix-turn-helix domain-containing protein [Novosphingobium resinovorum]